MSRRRYALKNFVHRVLAWRLFVACVAIAVAFGVLAYFQGYAQVGEGVLQMARNEIEWLKAGVRRQLEQPGVDLPTAVQAALDAPPEHQVNRHFGEFIYARFTRLDGEPLGEWYGPGPSARSTIDNYLASVPVTSNTAAGSWLLSTRLAGVPHIDLGVPVEDRRGRVVAQVRALFALSAATVAQVRRDTLVTVGYVVLIVLATTLLLYPVILNLTRRLARFSEGLLASNLETLQVLGSAIAKRDSDTDAHNYRVSLYSVRLAETLGMSTQEIRQLIKGAFLHDVGKIGIRDHILLKPGRLDDEEFRVMREHVAHGLDIVARSEWLQDAAAVVGGHHEKFDGSGYPQRLGGTRIPLGARVFAIADVFDALTSERPYKQPLSLQDALLILEQGRGTHFDPDLLDAFTAMAPDLYARYGGREDDNLKTELGEVLERYFQGGLETLAY